MKTAISSGVHSPWGRAFLAMLLCALPLVGVTAFPAQQAYADEVQETQQQEQQNAEEDTSSPGYEVYTFDGQDFIDAQTNRSGSSSSAVIPDFDVPLASSSHFGQTSSSTQTGSYFNAAIALLCAASMVAMLVMLAVRKTQDYRVIALRTIASAFGLVAITTWSLLDKLQIPTILFNDVSALIATLFVLYAVIAVASYVYEARLKKSSAE